MYTISLHWRFPTAVTSHHRSITWLVTCLVHASVVCELVLTILNAEETTQLRRKATWIKGRTTVPQTCDLRSIVEFQSRELSNRPRSFVPHRPLRKCLGNPHKSNIWFHHLMKSKYLASDFREEAHNDTIYIFGWTCFFNKTGINTTPNNHIVPTSHTITQRKLRHTSHHSTLPHTAYTSHGFN